MHRPSQHTHTGASSPSPFFLLSSSSSSSSSYFNQLRWSLGSRFSAVLRINSHRTSERSLALPLLSFSFLPDQEKAKSDACHSSESYSSSFFFFAAPLPGAESISSSSSGFKKTHQTQSNCRQGNMKITLTLALVLSVTFASVQAHRRRNSHNNNNSYGWLEVSSLLSSRLFDANQI